jgi:hypothetical protein
MCIPVGALLRNVIQKNHEKPGYQWDKPQLFMFSAPFDDVTIHVCSDCNIASIFTHFNVLH